MRKSRCGVAGSSSVCQSRSVGGAILGRDRRHVPSSRTCRVADLPTPALVVDAAALAHNLDTMTARAPRRTPAAAREGAQVHDARAASRPHAATAASPARRRARSSAWRAAGLGDDLLLANETVDPIGCAALADCGARVTVAVDSRRHRRRRGRATASARCSSTSTSACRAAACRPEDAGAIADLAASRGLDVRGVMGYEGHAVGLADRRRARRARPTTRWRLLAAAHDAVGGDVVSAGGTGTYDINTVATEIQAGSYALMDTAYGELDLPFEPRARDRRDGDPRRTRSGAVADCGLKALGMDHGNPTIDGADVWFCSDEHVTFAPDAPARGRRPRAGVARARRPDGRVPRVMHLADGPALDAERDRRRGRSTSGAGTPESDSP